MKINLVDLILEVFGINQNPSYDAIEKYYELYDIYLDELIEDFERNPNGKQPWSYIPFPRLQKIWSDFVKNGFVRDEKGLNRIAEIVVDNIVKVDINTTLAGHTMTDPEDELKDHGYDDIDLEKLYDYLEDDSSGHIRMSDYAMDDLKLDAGRILDSETPEEKLVNVDRAFNRIHRRSDIAGWFLKGGTSDLEKLSGTGEFSD